MPQEQQKALLTSHAKDEIQLAKIIDDILDSIPEVASGPCSPTSRIPETQPVTRPIQTKSRIQLVTQEEVFMFIRQLINLNGIQHTPSFFSPRFIYTFPHEEVEFKSKYIVFVDQTNKVHIGMLADKLSSGAYGSVRMVLTHSGYQCIVKTLIANPRGFNYYINEIHGCSLMEQYIGFVTVPKEGVVKKSYEDIQEQDLRAIKQNKNKDKRSHGKLLLVLKYFPCQSLYSIAIHNYINPQINKNKLIFENKIKAYKAILTLLNMVKMLHDQGLVHLNLKRDNILYDEKNNQFILINYGLLTSISDSDDGSSLWIIPSDHIGSSLPSECFAPELRTELKPGDKNGEGHLAQDKPVLLTKALDIYALGKLLELYIEIYNIDPYITKLIYIMTSNHSFLRPSIGECINLFELSFKGPDYQSSQIREPVIHLAPIEEKISCAKTTEPHDDSAKLSSRLCNN